MQTTYSKAIKDSFRLSKMYFTSSQWKSAWSLFLAVIALQLVAVYIGVKLSYWNRDFYNALEAKNWNVFVDQLETFVLIACAWIAVQVAKLYFNQWLQVRWRAWYTDHLVSRWMSGGRHYRMRIGGESSDNPDQRIAEDVPNFISTSLVLAVELLGTVVNLFSFIAILWGLSKEASFTLNGFDMSKVPGFMVIVAFLYAALGTWIIHVIGRRLTGLNFEQQRREADFRFNLVRLREYGESIALLKGEKTERLGIARRFGLVIENFYAIMNLRKYLTATSALYTQIATVLPVVIGAPAFFAGRVELGVLMQIMSAFNQVRDSFSFFIDAYTTIASWKATVERLAAFDRDVDGVETSGERRTVISRKSRASNTLEVQELAVFEPKTGKWLAGALSMSLARGDRKVMIGPSGAGKTSLVRALGGVWPYGTGEIRIPTGASMLVLPQQVYIPIGTLENALAYPNDVQAYPKHHYAEILIAVGLQGLVDQIEVEATWQERLSGGERQRIAIARALLSMPDFLILDEATSALDEASEAAILDLMEGRLPNTAILMVAHRSSVIRRYVDVVEVRRPVHDMVLDAPDRGDASPSHEPGVQAVPAF